MSSKTKNKGSKKPEQVPAPADRPSGNTALLLTSLAIVTTLIALISRIFLSAYPMNRDEGTYGYLGSLSVKGFIPYVDFYEMKPPVLYYLYGLGGTLFGFSDFGLRFFGLLLNLASGLLIYLILTRYIDKTYALVSSALFAMLSINLYALGFTMVAEHIVNTFVLLSFYLLIRSYDRKGLLLILLAGAAFAMAILTKQTAILLSPLFLLYLVMQRKQKAWFLQGITFAGGALIPALLLFVFLWANNALDDAYYWLFTYPAKYSSVVTAEEGKGFLKYFLKNITRFQLSLFGIAGLALATNIFFAKQKPNILLLTYFMLAVIILIPGFRFYGQYWLLLFAPLAMMTGTALHQLSRKDHRLGIGAAFIVLLCILGEAVVKRAYYFEAETTPDIVKLYRNNPFEAIRKLSTYAASLMKDNETIMMCGSEPQVYLYAGRTAPTRHVFMSMLTKHTEKTDAFVEEALSDLQDKKPDYVLYNLFPYSWSMSPSSNDVLYTSSFAVIAREYVPVAAYNMNDQQYTYAGDGVIDPKIINQVILFKRK